MKEAKAKVFCTYDEMVPVEDIRPNPRNPNRHPEEQVRMLAKIITENGWRAPITVSTRSGMVVRGHGRLMAAIFAGLAECPVDYQDYDSDEQEMQDMLADNRIAELAEIDQGMLDSMLGELSQVGADIELAGFLDDLDDGIEIKDEKPEVPFTDVLNEEHNYIVLYFDNEIDWMQAQTLFDIKQVKAFSTRMDGSENPKTVKRGIGRVLRGATAIENLRRNTELSQG